MCSNASLRAQPLKFTTVIVTSGMRVMYTCQDLISRAHSVLILVRSTSLTMPTTGYTTRSSDGARERQSEHQMMIFLARPYNQRLTTLNTHQ